MSKIKGKSIKLSSPFDSSSHKTERTANQKFVEWINQIVKERNLPIGIAEQETVGADRKQPDIIIFESSKSEKILCLIELKPPYFSPFDEKELKRPAWEKANKRKAKYFATSNFQWLIWFNTEKVNKMEPEERQIVDKFHLSTIEDLDDIEDTRFKNSILKSIEKFLEELVRIHTGVKSEPLLPIDEFLIFRLQEKIYRLAKYYKPIIKDKAHKDNEFLKKFQKWFIEQQWTFTFSESDFEKAARQTAYLLINKILFYDVLQSKRSGQLDPLTLPDDLTKGGVLQNTLQSYFDYVLKNIDYETIYSTDFIDQIAFPENRPVIEEIKELIKVLKRYDFSKIGFDIIGRIFERLIPQEERHNLGQYFTNPDIVDLILGFCVRNEKDTVLDPSCGAGTFLVRAYQHKKMMNFRMPHQEILKTLWGVDIAKFPAHLSTINLAVNELSVDENYPQILNEDFFNLTSLEKTGGEEVRKKALSTLSGKKVFTPYPKNVDCIVGNPPYTRQEEISEMTGKESYKECMINKALFDEKGRLADISKRAGIHAYFFVHGTKFLKEAGRFGFIVSNSWMDVDYGKGLQELFLNSYKIIAIIESKVERWFEDADVNTCIIILEKCNEQKERNENLVRFIYLFKPLRHFIPPAHDMWEKQKQRLDAIENLRKTILFHNNFYKNEDLRIFPKKQKELWDEGFDAEEDKYTGSKWGKYLRAPEIFFKILEKSKDKLMPLKEIADVRFGIKTGANKFFYLTEKEIEEREIEKEFWMYKDEKGKWSPNHILHSFKETPSISVDHTNLNRRILLIHKDKKDLKGTNILKYIRMGETREFNGKVPANTVSCSSRGERWYDLGKNNLTHIFYPRRIGDRFLTPYSLEPIFSSDNLFPVLVKSEKDIMPLAAFLNSIVAALFNELSGRRLTGAINVVDMDVWMAKKILVPNFNIIAQNILSELKEKFTALSKRPIEHTLKELGSSTPEAVLLDKVKPDRRELDKIIMGDILGLTEDEQLEVYRAVVDLVRSRIEKAKSLGNKGKIKEGVDVELLTKTIKEKLGDKLFVHFYNDKILNQKNLKTVKLFSPTKEIQIKNELFGWRLSSGKDYIDCQSEAEAEYLKIWLESGIEEVKVPKDESYLLKVLPELKALKAKIDRIISDHILSIVSQKLRAKILQKLQGELFG
ncbi:MAG: hypothetical protein A3C43_04960 [Candidatus Schekmanbacteria bacterium RIFCSPHIGHO2_02_FULL_38_11]|uniref:site-specific DNA-methyltransferase (adenine-specific) n=1 Tax=Candidatus Schekmanbacteria bacterium RIFCSPLOWO2_12_FULL_38_15 TaxID=1817883 RepID=A0A1F7SC70_9BACT|nr:MAG: hypothetical protein A3G31_03500 [Candidatus Schekmanbacteria bacterium RIFCSPLOWO2_12_FULL_38_15]OGL51798.1 MAG: hypothetical protein A3C43_04960 [Candidatus Schekmanbacteria bacterium RIFCSPHIGHO2_02_FULL_38_11]